MFTVFKNPSQTLHESLPYYVCTSCVCKTSCSTGVSSNALLEALSLSKWSPPFVVLTCSVWINGFWKEAWLDMIVDVFPLSRIHNYIQHVCLWSSYIEFRWLGTIPRLVQDSVRSVVFFLMIVKHKPPISIVHSLSVDLLTLKKGSFFFITHHAISMNSTPFPFNIYAPDLPIPWGNLILPFQYL